MPGNKFIKNFFLTLIFIIPLAVYMGLGDPSSTLKAFLVRSGALILWLLIFFQGRLFIPSKKTLLFFSFFAAGSLIPAFYAQDLSVSLIGIYPFYAYSVFTFVCLAVFFFFSCSLKKENIESLISVILSSCALVSIYGILQFSGIDFLEWQGRFYPRIWSTMGNPNFLAAYLGLVFPLSAFRYLRSGKIIYFLTTLLVLLCILLTASRGGILAASAGLIMFYLIMIKENRYKKRLKQIGFAVTALFVITVLIKPQAFNRFTGTFTVKESNTASRISQWRTGLKMFLEKPAAGFGLNSYYTSFRKYMSAEFIKNSSELSNPGYPHNYIIKILTDGGILFAGLIAAWWIFAGTYLFKNRCKSQYMVGALFVSFAVFFIQSLFSFSTIAVNLIFYVLLGAGFALSAETKSMEVNKYLAYLLILPVVFLLFFSVKRLYADYLFSKENYQKASSLAPEITKYRMSRGKELYLLKEYEGAGEIFKQQIKKTPYFALAYNGLASVYMKQGNLDKAIENFNKALEKDPFLLDSHLKLAECYKLKLEYDKAKKHYKASIEINPGLTAARYNLGVIYYKNGQIAEARQEWAEVLKRDPGNKEAENALKFTGR